MIEPTELINGKPVRRQGVCGVIATANVTGRTPQDVFDLFKKSRGLDCGKRWRGALHNWALLKMLDRLKVKHEPVKVERCTLQKFTDWHAAKGQTYIVNVTNHYVVVCNGLIADQGGAKPILEAWARRRFVQKVWHIKNPAIDKQAASVAASPAMEKPTVTEAARQYLAEIGRKGGKNNKHQAKAAQTYWARLTPAQRSEEMRKRAEKRLKNRAEKK